MLDVTLIIIAYATFLIALTTLSKQLIVKEIFVVYVVRTLIFYR